MKRIAAVTVLMVAVIILTACSGGSSGSTSSAPAVKEDPRDALIKSSIKSAMSTNPVELIALFENHPEMHKAENASVADKMLMAAFVVGGINGYDLDLSRLKGIRLKVSKFSSAKRYCLDGTFNYSGPAKTGAGKIEIMDGTGTIFTCTSTNKDGQLYLDKLEFKLDGRTISSAKKAAKAGGK